MTRTGGAVVAALLAAGCGTSSTVFVADIPPQDPALVAGGEMLYQASCAECHGVDLRGTDRGPSHLSGIYEPNHHADIAFLLAVRRGTPAHHWTFGAMAPVEGLSEDDVAAIVAYVREAQRTEGFEAYPP